MAAAHSLTVLHYDSGHFNVKICNVITQNYCLHYGKISILHNIRINCYCIISNS